jgi:hypothetical protein
MSDVNDAAGEVQAASLAAAATNWNGLGMSLPQSGSVNMPQTPNGTLVFGYFNLTTQNSAGELVLTSGGSYFNRIPVPPGQSVPGLVVNNWQAGNLSVSNTSANTGTGIYISAYGPGVPGQAPSQLAIGKAVNLGTTASTQGATNPQNMLLRITVSGSAMGVFAIVGGPPDASGNNAKVIAVNYQGAAPEGYHAVTSSNSYTLSFNWNGAGIYVVNMSATGTPLGQVLLLAV